MKTSIILEKIEKIPSLVFVLLLVWFTIRGEHTHWYYLHSNMFIVLIAFLCSAIAQIKQKNVLFLSSLIVSIAVEELDILHHFSNWLFFNSSIAPWFNFIAVKDANVGSIILILVFTIILFLIEAYRGLRNRFNLTNMFILITSGAIIFTTAIFHYYIINYNLKREKDILLSHTLALSKINPPLLQLLCKSQDYVCYVSPKKEEILSHTPELSDVYDKYLASSNLIQESFIFEDKFILTTKKDNIWILDFTHYREAFKNAEKIFLSLCIYAHGFWLMFMTFLIVSHQKRKKPKL